MKDKIINKIIHELTPLRTLYKEIDEIINDLLLGKLDSLETFLGTEFEDIYYSKDLKDLIISLVQNNKLPNTYLFFIQDDINNTKLSFIDPYNYKNSILIGFKALNIKEKNFENIIFNINKGINNPSILILRDDIIHPKLSSTESFHNTEHDIHETIPINNQNENPKLITISDYHFPEFEKNKEDNNVTNDKDLDDEILSLEDTHIEKLRKIILSAQLNYLNNATLFIEELEKKDEPELYQTLLSLNDIRYIQHSISKLSTNTQKRLLDYVEFLLKENSHNSLNIFIQEAIKKNLHNNHEKKM